MADYTVLSSVSRSVVRLLGDNMIPRILRGNDSIALCSPSEKGTAQLYVYLYNIAECREIAQNYNMLGIDGMRANESKFLYLYYQITASASSEIRFRALEEQDILGKVIQIFNDNPSISIQDYSGRNRAPEEGIPVSMVAMTSEEISKIWSSLQMTHRTALYYRVGPVELESEIITKIPRVTGASFGTKEI